MMTTVTAPARLSFADGGKVTTSIVERASRNKGRTAVVGRAAARTRLLLEVAERLDRPVLVRVPEQLDRVPYVLLSIASQCGAPMLRRAADAFGQGTTALLDVLRRGIGDRPLLVADLHRLRTPVPDYDLPLLAGPMGEVRRWLYARASVATFEGAPPPGFERAFPPRLRAPRDTRELWGKVDHDPDRFALALLRKELGVEPTDDPAWDAESLVQDVWSALSSRERALVFALVIHGRPIGASLLVESRLCDAEVLERAIRNGLVEHRGKGPEREVWLAGAWYEHCPDLQIPNRRINEHRRLGKAFAELARRDDSNPMTVLEACRHLSEAGDVAEAAQFARFGALVLLDAGRRSSLAGEWDQAIRTYEIIERLPGLDNPTRAYAIHYGAYNRYRARREPIAETLRAYQKSVTLWPENARFWSRLVSGLCIDRRRTEALERLAEAQEAVPEHPNKWKALVGDTAERLLERNLIQDAALVWGDATPTGSLEDPGKQLEERLAEGFEDDRTYGQPELVLYEPKRLRVTKAGGAWTATGLGATERGRSPRAAIAAWTRKVREETERLLRTPTHLLEPTERQRKGELLGAIDVLQSCIGPRADDAWISGTLERDGDEVVLVTEDGQRFTVHESLRGEVDVPAAYRLGRVALDKYRQPRGPVLELEPVADVDANALWEEWKRRVGEG